MPAGWGPTRVEERRLAEKNEGFVAGKCSFRFYNLFKRAPDVNGRSPRAFASSPGDRSTQGIVNLESAGAITETLQPPAVTRGQLGTCDPKKLSGSNVGENEVALRELRNFVIDFDTAAKTSQVASEGICESLSATSQNGPATRVGGRDESQTNGG